MAEKRTIEFEVERETKNTVRFQELEGDGPAAIGVLYVQKSAVKQLGSPKRIRVTIEPVEA